MENLELLKKARGWLSDRSHWTKRTYYRDKWGHEVGQHQTIAKTCLIGALFYCSEDKKIYGAERLLLECLSPSRISIVEFNDDSRTKHEEVLALLDCAIEKASRG